MFKKGLFFLLILGSFFELKAQANVRDSIIGAFVPHVSYSYQFPGGDITKKYGDNSTIGVGLRYKTVKNYIFSFL